MATPPAPSAPGPVPPKPAGGPPPSSIMSPGEAVEAVRAELPTDGQYSVATIEKLADATNKAMKDVLGDNAPPGEVKCPPYPEKKHMGQLPVECVLPALILLDAGASVDKKYATDPAELRDDSDVREVIAKLGMLAKDKKVKAAMMPAESEEEEEVDVEVVEKPPAGVAEAM